MNCEGTLEKSLSKNIVQKQRKSLSEGRKQQATKLVVAPDGGWGWVVVAASFMCNFLVDGITFSGGILSKHIQLEFQITDREVAPVNSLLAGFSLLAGPFVSAFTNKYGFRVMTIIGSLVASAAFVLSYFATSVEYLYLSYGILGGLGFCMAYLPSIVIVGFYFERWRALAMGLALCGSGVGTFVLAPLTDVLIENFGWRICILIHAGFVLLCVVCGAMYRPIKPVQVILDNSEVLIDSSNRKPKYSHNYEMSLPHDKAFKTIPRSFSDIGYSTKEKTFRDSPRLNRRQGSENPISIREIIGNKSILKLSQKSSQGGSSNDLGNREPLIGLPFKVVPQAERSIRSDVIKADYYLYRDDIFYGSSLQRLPQYTSRSSLEYHLAVTRIQSKNDRQNKFDEKCQICPVAIRKMLGTVLDVRLLQSPTFIVLAISGFFSMLGFFVPYMFVAQRAIDNGVDRRISAFLVSTIGVANIIGRITSGLLSSMPRVSSLVLYNTALTIGGTATMVSGLHYHDAYQFGYCVVFGLSMAFFVSLRSILIVEYIGLEKLTSCFGLFLLFQGTGALLGSPIAGVLIDLTGRYDVAFYVSGGFLLFSAILSYPVGYVCRWEKARSKRVIQTKI